MNVSEPIESGFFNVRGKYSWKKCNEDLQIIRFATRRSVRFLELNR